MKFNNINVDTESLLTRQDYLVVQGNDLARAFGRLKAFEHRVLDYCFSLVTKESAEQQVYEVSTSEIIKHLGLNKGGNNYKRVGNAFKTLNENTAIYLPTFSEDLGKGIVMTQLFSEITFYESGNITFVFSPKIEPYVIGLSEHYYSFKLSELSKIKGKYALIMLKLWESNRHGKNRETVIKGDVEDWQSWFLGDKRVPNGRFFRDMLTRSCEEIEEKIDCNIYIDSTISKKKITGYIITIIDNRVL